MNFASIGNSQKKGNNDRWTNLKKTFFPTALAERKKRMQQYKDVAIFLGSILVVALFEKKIEKFITVDKSEIQQMTSMQQGMHSAY